jgi:hypothetical protein
MDPQELQFPEQLPEIDGRALVLTWDQDGPDSIITCGGQLVWRERTGWEVYERFAEIIAVAQRRYGARLRDVLLTQDSKWALLGDSSRAWAHVEAARARLARPAPAEGSDAPPLSELHARFLELCADARRRVHARLCARAVAAWQRYSAAEGQLTYIDSVIGMFHVVDARLPADAWVFVFGRPRAGSLEDIEYRYREPTVALQDGDLELPDPIYYGYHAVYNAFLVYAMGRPIDDWLIVNQALSVLPREEARRAALHAALSG